MLGNQNFNTVNLLKFENNSLFYVYAKKKVHDRCGNFYTFIACIADELNEETELIHFWSN